LKFRREKEIRIDGFLLGEEKEEVGMEARLKGKKGKQFLISSSDSIIVRV
jgi:hypothetical protein